MLIIAEKNSVCIYLVSIFMHYSHFPNKRSFRGPGGVSTGLDSFTGLKSVSGNWPLWSPVVSWGASRGLPWPPVASR